MLRSGKDKGMKTRGRNKQESTLRHQSLRESGENFEEQKKRKGEGEQIL